MIFVFQRDPIFVWGLTYQLGAVSRTLDELKEANLINSPVEALSQVGYRANFGIGAGETLLALAGKPFSRALTNCKTPDAFVFHHSYAENAVVRCEQQDSDLMSRCQYFPAALMRQFGLDQIPFFGSFATGCVGFISALLSAAGLLRDSAHKNVICLTADVRPSGATFDGLREKILTSDASSAFLVGRDQRGYELLGVNYYSTTRNLIPLVEIVKRTVLMIRELADQLGIVLSETNFLVHYPNIFPEAWKMVSNYLRIQKDQHVVDDLPARAHCLSTDTVITLAKLHRGESARLHIVVNFGSGLHLGVCFLKEITFDGSSV
jgi:hypothetical protein